MPPATDDNQPPAMQRRRKARSTLAALLALLAAILLITFPTIRQNARIATTPVLMPGIRWDYQPVLSAELHKIGDAWTVAAVGKPALVTPARPVGLPAVAWVDVYANPPDIKRWPDGSGTLGAAAEVRREWLIYTRIRDNVSTIPRSAEPGDPDWSVVISAAAQSSRVPSDIRDTLAGALVVGFGQRFMNNDPIHVSVSTSRLDALAIALGALRLLAISSLLGLFIVISYNRWRNHRAARLDPRFCRNCRYEVGELPICPECGSPAPSAST